MVAKPRFCFKYLRGLKCRKDHCSFLHNRPGPVRYILEGETVNFIFDKQLACQLLLENNERILERFRHFWAEGPPLEPPGIGDFLTPTEILEEMDLWPQPKPPDRPQTSKQKIISGSKASESLCSMEEGNSSSSYSYKAINCSQNNSISAQRPEDSKEQPEALSVSVSGAKDSSLGSPLFSQPESPLDDYTEIALGIEKYLKGEDAEKTGSCDPCGDKAGSVCSGTEGTFGAFTIQQNWAYLNSESCPESFPPEMGADFSEAEELQEVQRAWWFEEEIFNDGIQPEPALPFLDDSIWLEKISLEAGSRKQSRLEPSDIRSEKPTPEVTISRLPDKTVVEVEGGDLFQSRALKKKARQQNKKKLKKLKKINEEGLTIPPLPPEKGPSPLLVLPVMPRELNREVTFETCRLKKKKKNRKRKGDKEGTDKLASEIYGVVSKDKEDIEAIVNLLKLNNNSDSQIMVNSQKDNCNIVFFTSNL